mmetsp:Transcript_15512/g.18907  ORF Transcript_15512/g.18907 Transcript_15512/m.18907 type:complete len:217 (+) Transcript_15512:1171-1821(+)
MERSWDALSLVAVNFRLPDVDERNIARNCVAISKHLVLYTSILSSSCSVFPLGIANLFDNCFLLFCATRPTKEEWLLETVFPSNQTSLASRKFTCNLHSIASWTFSKSRAFNPVVALSLEERSISTPLSRLKAVTISKHCGIVTSDLNLCSKCLLKSASLFLTSFTIFPTIGLSFCASSSCCFFSAEPLDPDDDADNFKCFLSKVFAKLAILSPSS